MDILKGTPSDGGALESKPLAERDGSGPLQRLSAGYDVTIPLSAPLCDPETGEEGDDRSDGDDRPVTVTVSTVDGWLVVTVAATTTASVRECR